MTGKMFPAPEEQRDPAAILEKISSPQKVPEDVEERLDQLMRPGHVLYVPDPMRDQFAMAALTGIMARCEVGSNQLKVMAEDCYKIADAMLEARKK